MLTDAQIRAKYGEPGDYDNFVSFQTPFPMRIAWDLKQTVTKITCHKGIKDRLENAFKEILDHYGLQKVKELGIDLFGGCVNVRTMRGSKTRWSRHAWGIAIDLDPARNTLKMKWSQSNFSKPEYAKMHEIFEANGFINYGKVRGFDSMHFETAI